MTARRMCLPNVRFTLKKFSYKTACMSKSSAELTAGFFNILIPNRNMKNCHYASMFIVKYNKSDETVNIISKLGGERLCTMTLQESAVYGRFYGSSDISSSLWRWALSSCCFLITYRCSGLIIGFKAYKIQDGIAGMFTSSWVGLKYLKEFVNDYNFPLLVKNTLLINLLKLLFSFPLPIIFAVMLNEFRHRKLKRIVQTASYLPYFISWVIVSGFAVNFLNTQNGIINQLMATMGLIEKPINFLTKAQYYWPIAVITSIWKDMGWWAIVFLAAIVGVDQELYEAARIDGAGRIQRILHVTLPSIAPTVTVVLILSLGNLLGGGLGRVHL